MFEPGTVTIQNCLFFGDIPKELGDWCKRREIEGRLFEIFDGGGHTGHLIDFKDAATKDRVAENFLKEFPRQQCLMGEAIKLLGSLAGGKSHCRGEEASRQGGQKPLL